MKAAWISDYDYKMDSIYRRPGCLECYAPIGKDEDGKYRCFSCGQAAELDPDMIEWITEREGFKQETGDCYSCGGKGCMITDYIRDNVTKEWTVAGGRCDACGMRFIV